MVAPGQVIQIKGSNFLKGSASGTLVAFDQGQPIPPGTIQNDFIRATAPTTLQAGTRTVRVICDVAFPSGSTRTGFTSNAVPFC